MPPGSILGVWAHPDDETFMVGGLLALAARSGQHVACVTATKGEAGVQDETKWPKDSLGDTREKELSDALGILGITEHNWLGYSDGRCADVPEEEAISRLVVLIEQYQPDTVITFPPDGLTGHTDHKCVSRWATMASERSRKQPNVYFAVNTSELYDAHLRALDEQINIYFALDKPVLIPEAECDVVLRLDAQTAGLKVAALAAMPSQTAGMFAQRDVEELENIFGCEALVSSRNAARWADL